MKKYKLIKEYPGVIGSLGRIAEKKVGGTYYEFNRAGGTVISNYSNEYIENHPEFWRDISDETKAYEYQKEQWIYFVTEIDGVMAGNVGKITDVVIEGYSHKVDIRGIWLTYRTKDKVGGFRAGGNGYVIKDNFKVFAYEEEAVNYAISNKGGAISYIDLYNKLNLTIEQKYQLLKK